MAEGKDKPGWSLPVVFSPPVAGRRRIAAVRVAVGIALAAALIAPVMQFQLGTMKSLRKAEAFDRSHPDWTRADALACGPVRPKSHKGAVGRWRQAVRQLWQGRNIYEAIPAGDRPYAHLPPEQVPVRMHPNMPLVVVLLTPFAYMPVWAMALSFNLLKLAVLAGTLWMAVRLANHRGHRMAGWVLALSLVWSMKCIIGDIQHGNTNTFVLGAVVLHLWLYRSGRDTSAGAALAAAICLKMTPALFVLYWLYQRNWKLLGGAAVAMVFFAVAVPLAAVGPGRYVELTDTWLNNLILPGLIRGDWYPEHINQSLSGVMARYFLAGPPGNIFWGPDENPYEAQKKFQWITFVAVSPGVLKIIVRILQLAIVAAIAWAVGWRRPGRDDGRRMLHYGLVLLGMMLLNQRTWDHHSAVLLPASLGLWYAITYGRVSRRLRVAAVAVMIPAGLAVWLSGSGVVELIARLAGLDAAGVHASGDIVEAYGPVFYHFALMLIAAVMLAVALRKTEKPYFSAADGFSCGGVG
ncbi:MAG: glycosyltransferase family 87 protein [Planctomycetota bacterium]|nr:glycosyltransferase family 87 protein [Planctomycetota bacterium]